MGEFIKDRLPDAVSYFEAEGVPMVGPGRWKTGPCHFHGGSDSLRVHVQTGAFRCMACGVKGGDVLAYTMQRHGIEFVDAARSLGAYVEDGKPLRGADPAHDAIGTCGDGTGGAGLADCADRHLRHQGRRDPQPR